MTSLPIDRRYCGIRIKKASGTTDKKQHRRLLGMLDALEAKQRVDIIQSIADGNLSLAQVWDAFRRDGIDHLPTAETLRPLMATWEAFVENYEGAASHRQDLKYTSAAVLRHAPADATLEELPVALAAYRLAALRDKTPRQFNKARANAQAFLRRTVGKAHRLWWAVTAIDRIKENRGHGQALTPDELEARLVKLPKHIAGMARTMALHGMGPKEYWEDGWSADRGNGKLSIDGKKRDGRQRVVPLILWPMTAPQVEYPAFRRALLKVGLKTYDLRRTYARALEDVGLTLSEQRALLGHGPRSVTELYPRHDMTPRLSAIGDKLYHHFKASNGER